MENSETSFSVGISEDNRAIIVDYDGHDAAQRSAKMINECQMISNLWGIYLLGIAGYALYGVISFMIEPSISFHKIGGWLLLFVGWLALTAVSHEVDTVHQRYLKKYADAKILLRENLMILEEQMLQHRIKLENIEKKSKMNFLAEKEMNA